MFTLDKLMEYINTAKVFKDYDMFFRAEKNKDNTITIYRFDGTLDDENSFVCMIDDEFNISIDKYNPTWADYHNLDLISETGDEENPSSINTFANIMIASTITYIIDEMSLMYETVSYLNKLLEKQNCSCVPINDIYNRTWNVINGRISVMED